jgi:hypothetical protein
MSTEKPEEEKTEEDKTLVVVDPTNPDTTEREVNFVVKQLSKMFNAKSINVARLTLIILQGMLIMKKFRTIPGKTKKEILLNSLRRLVMKHSEDMDDEERLTVQLLIEQMAPSLIDTLFYASEQKMNFNIKNGLLSCCFGKKDPEIDDEGNETTAK